MRKVYRIFQKSEWIWIADPPEREFYRVIFCLHRKIAGAASLDIAVTADALYELRINGKRIGRGPTRGDLNHYRFETYNVESDENLFITVSVIPPNPWLASGEMHLAPGFLFDCSVKDAQGEVIDRICSDSSWKAAVDPSFDRNECDDKNWQTTPMAAAGYGEARDFRLDSVPDSPDDTISLDWQSAISIDAKDGIRILESSPLPHPETRAEELGALFRPGHDNMLELPCTVDSEQTDIFIDHGRLTTGFPTFVFRDGAGRKLRIYYAEVMRNGTAEEWFLSPDKETCLKVRCHSREQSTSQSDIPPMVYYDDLILGEGETVFTPSYLRTFRFLKLRFSAGPRARLERTEHCFSAYPFSLRARFSCSDPELEKIFHTAFRGLRLCAHDHFEDCPYYEGLQYAGDTGVQALLSYYLTGDLRLGEQALRQFAWSSFPEIPELIQTRYPSNIPQLLPSFCFPWMRMIENLLRFTDDQSSLEEIAPRMVDVIRYFDRAESGGFLPIAGKSFIDWAWGHCLQGFRVPVGEGDTSAIVNLQAAWGLDSAARSLRRVGRVGDADIAAGLAERLRKGVRGSCMSSEGIVLDGPGLETKSQHGQVWAVLTDLVPVKEQHRMFDTALNDPDIAPSSLYHDFYLFRAAEKLDRYEEVWPRMRIWKELVDHGFSTFPEEDGRFGFIRSECHAWSAWVGIDLLSMILGVKILGPQTVHIDPHPCGLERAEGAVPLGDGLVEVAWHRKGEKIEIEADFPKGVEGTTGPEF